MFHSSMDSDEKSECVLESHIFLPCPHQQLNLTLTQTPVIITYKENV